MLGNRNFSFLYRLIGVVLFIVICSRIDLAGLRDALKDVDLKLLLITILLSLLIGVVKSSRWKGLLNLQDIYPNSFSEVTRVFFIGCFLGTVTIGRLGELARVTYLKKKVQTFNYVGAIISVLVDRLLDIVLLLIVSLLGMLFISKIYFIVLMSVGLLSFLCLYFFWIKRNLLMKFFVKTINNIISKYSKDFAGLEASYLISKLNGLRKKEMLFAVTRTLGAWGIFYLVLFLMAKASHIQINFFYLISIVSATMFLSMMPISIAGIGVRDVVLIFFFQRVNLSSEQAVAFSILHLLVFLLVPSFIGFICYLLDDFKRSNENLVCKT